MGNEYTIKVKGQSGGVGAKSRPSGIGGDINAVRAKAIQAQKESDRSGKTSLTALKELNNTMKHLIASNKALAEIIKRMNTGGGAGHGSGGGVTQGEKGGSVRGLAAGAIGGGLLGFALGKANMIGQAYISTAAEQSRNVGTGGFRRGQGMYTAGEMGSGMRSYSMSSGRYAHNEGPNRAAIQMGNVYGLSADEALSGAGKFARAGANYDKAVYTGAGAGIETQLPQLIASIGDELEEAVRGGIDSSGMSKDIAEDMAALTAATRNKDVNTAIAITQSIKSLKSDAAKGKVNSLEGVMAYQAAGKKTLAKFNDKNEGGKFIESLVAEGSLDMDEANKLHALRESGQSLTEKDINSVTGGQFNTFTQRQLEQQSLAETTNDLSKGYQGIVGTGAKGVRSAFGLATSTGSDFSFQDMLALSKVDATRGGINATKGQALIEGASKGVTGSNSGMSVDLINQQQNLLLNSGQKFAEASKKATEALLDLASAMDKGTSAIIKTSEEYLKKHPFKFGLPWNNYEAQKDVKGAGYKE